MQITKSLNKLGAALLISLTAFLGVSTVYADKSNNKSINIEMFAPAKGDAVGIGGRGWFVDLAIAFEDDLESTGFNGFQLTGPAGHNNIDPFPGEFALGADDRLPGLIVLLSTTTIGTGSCQNIADLFNLTGVTNVTDDEIELWDTWIVGAPLFGVDTKSKIYVAIADDIDGDGVYNDAPDTLPDYNGDGRCNTKDLKAFGIASNIEKAKFYINP